MAQGTCRYCKKVANLTPYGRCQKCEDIFRAWTARLHRREFKNAMVIEAGTGGNRQS